MIAVAAGANQMYPWACSITGLGAGLSYLTFIELAKKLKVDDPLDAFALHVGGGIWGLVAVCIVGEKGIFYGIFYPEHTSFLNSLAVNFFCKNFFKDFQFLATWVEHVLCISDNNFCTSYIIPIVLYL